MNGVDLDLFDFERDLTFMAFFMNNRDGIYARYGGRGDDDAESHLTKASLLKVMREVLRRHEAGEAPPEPAGPIGRAPRTPEQFPTMKAMMSRRKEKCIHCHDVKVADLRHRQSLGTFSRDQIFTYPMPSALGLSVDPDDQQGIRAVEPGSPAAEAGIKPGDTLTAVGDRRVLTAGDIARVLELTPAKAELPVEVRRDGRPVSATLKLNDGWRRASDPSWRASVEVAGPNVGFWAKPLSRAEKTALRLEPDALALQVTFLFPKHPTPPAAGLKLGDVIVEVEGKRRALTTRQLHAYSQMNKDDGDTMPIVVLRDGEEMKLTLTLRRVRD